ncbi:MAG TPA: secretin N-terminal domain-containing protein [Anaerohalosphaeraceae bacterium]|mgnify:CR=1 FL=1|nr:secretin N-terminal domain-containing protein [Anaerohalosphaeraceae bacterium]HOM75767.1 secretin N-terminal domain-containing protein [Anaerohalosphaeraceae bacterium]HPC63942.1 secretin N-terminal domain-containing protein [Anaerohalosphaeraceae bacterium]HPO69317.1 secretin N-terminal domain-containing protein [Anaerohalosphaeraceae bacterium]HRS70397.1 secretin N-terminal domain-containing protein [Anaerohalosphaeraceae bacterium]
MQSYREAGIGQRKQWLAGLCILFWLSAVLMGQSGGVLRSRVYKLKHITSQQAKELLVQLNIGKSYNTLTRDVLIVTSDVGTDLLKATEIVPFLDQEPPVQIRVLMTAADSACLPTVEMLAARLKTITFGTMNEAPVRGAAKAAIVDTVNGKLLAIGTVDVLNEIEAAAADLGQQSQTSASAQKAESAAAEKPLEPNLPATLMPLAETNLPAQEEPNALTPQTSAFSTEKPLEEAARQIFEGVPQLSDVNAPSDSAPAAAAEKSPEEDFLSEELMKALADAEETARAAQSAAQPVQETAPVKEAQTQVPEPNAAQAKPQEAKSEPTQPEQTAPAEPIDPMKVLQALMAQAQQEEKALVEEQAQAEAAQQAAASSQDKEHLEKLQTELAQLRQKLADLEALAGQAAPSGNAAEAKVQSAGSAPIPAEIAEKELETVIDLPQEVELEALVDLVGKQLGLNYMYDPTILKGQKVQLKIHGGKIKVKDTYALLESVLRFKGFIMTRRGQLVTIMRDSELAKAEPVLRAPDEPIQPGDIVVSSLFTLQYIDAATAQNMLKTMNLGTNFTPLETNSLIVTDYAYRMDRIRQVLTMVDVPAAAKEYRFRTLKYIKPSDIVGKLKDLAGQLQGVTLQISAAAATPAAATQTRTVTTRNPQTGQMETRQVPIPTPATATATPAPQTSAAVTGAAKDTVFIDTDDRTNRILIVGRADQIALIEELVDVLDVPQYDLKYVREYIIQNVEAIEVVNVLNELGLANVAVATQAAGRTAARTAARTVSPQAQQVQEAAVAVQRTPTAGTAASGDQPYVSIRPATNSLLVNGTAEQHRAIELVIAHVDVVQKDQRTIRQYEIQYVDTQTIIDALTDLGIIAPSTSASTGAAARGTSARTSSLGRTTAVAQAVPTAAEQAAAPMVLPTAEGGSEVELTADYPQITVLQTTNSLLVYATPRQHDAIALVIAHADRQLDVTTTPYVVYALENQDPVELAEVLTKLIQETVEERAKTSSPEAKIQTAPASGTAAGGGAPPTLEEQKIRIIPDPMSYSLIVYANKRNQQWIGELIRELDEYRPQVLLDCTLVEITKDESFKYDLDVISKTYNELSLRSPSPISTISGNFSQQQYGEARSKSGEFTGFYNSDAIQALLTAVQTKSYGRVMARPKVLVNDNQEGEIKTENKTSIAQQKSIVQPATGTSPSYTTTDVSFSEYSEGVILKIKPHISKGDMLRLEISLSRTDFTERQDVTVAGQTYPRPPDLLSTDITTVATVPDGTTIILGGLEGVDQQKASTKVPIMGDLPIVGGLFRGVNDKGSQSKLYVFVKANILRPSDQIEGLDDIRRVSSKNRQAFEEMEKKFQEHQDWPGIKPKPMEPVTVLEEDDFEQLRQELKELNER